MNVPEAPTPGIEEPEERPRLISRARATVNTILFISAGLFFLGWLNMVMNVGQWSADRLAGLTVAMAYIGLIALASFIASVILILVENRTGPLAKGGEP